jgi:hypothetical protein
MGERRRCHPAAWLVPGVLLLAGLGYLAVFYFGWGYGGATEIVLRNETGDALSLEIEIVEHEHQDRISRYELELARGESVAIEVVHGVKTVRCLGGPRHGTQFDQWNGETVDLEIRPGPRLEQVFPRPPKSTE